MNDILNTISEQIKNISILLNPIIPNSTYKVLDVMNISSKDVTIENIKNEKLINHNKELNDMNILFKKIEDDN